MSSARHTFAEQLNELFARLPRRTTSTAVAIALTEQGCSISTAYLSQLRTGVRNRPADRYVRAFAEYFDVPLSYFCEAGFEDESDTGFERDLQLVHMIQDDSVRRLLCNAHGLSLVSLDILLRFEDHLRVQSHRRVRRI